MKPCIRNRLLVAIYPPEEEAAHETHCISQTRILIAQTRVVDGKYTSIKHIWRLITAL